MSSSDHYSKGREFQAKQEYQKALEAYTRAIELDPKNPDLYSYRGICHFHLKQMEKSLEDMNRSVELQPEYSYRYSSRAYIKANMKDLDGAIADYHIAIKLDPDDAIAFNNLGLLEEQRGRKEQAEKHFKEADKLADEQGLFKEMIQKDPKKEETQKEEKPKEEPHQGVPLSPEPLEPKKAANWKDHLKEMAKVFSSKESFKEFLKFIQNGLKLKE